MSLIAISAPRPPGWKASPVWTSLPSASNTRSAPNAASTGSSKRNTTWLGAASSFSPRLGIVSCSVACADATAGTSASSERSEGERAPHHASTGSFFSSGAPGVPSPPPDARRRRTMMTAIESTMISAAKPKIAPSGSPPSSSGTQVSVPLIAPGGARDLDRDLPVVVDHRLLALVGEVGRVAGAHPVHAMVVPLVAAALGDLLPLGLGAEVLRHGGLALAVLVEVVRLGVRVHADRAVGLQLDVRLLLVVEDHDVLAARVVHEHGVVEVEDAGVEARRLGRDGLHDGAIVRVALVGERDGRGEQQRGRRHGAGEGPHWDLLYVNGDEVTR